MKTTLIGPDNLEADAVVPQCLDNQYVSDAVFTKMVERGVNYRDIEIAKSRENDFKTEFIRSLVYSSQVIIQRAFLNNSEFLYKNYLPENGENLTAFSKLVRDKAVMPYLFKESSLLDNLAFDKSKDGDRALKALLSEIGDEVTCVRLAVDEAANQRAAEIMETKFGAGLSGLMHMGGEQRNAMASELFADSQRLWKEETWDAFNKSIDSLARYAFSKSDELRNDLKRKNKQLSRNDVYLDNFVVRGEGAVVNGQFRRPGLENPFLLELKKYVDLVYNTNLPDRLKRYTFTPVNMPSRMALQDDPGSDYSDNQVRAIVSNDDAMEFMRRTFMAHSQKAMSLPLLSDLTVADVLELRGLPEWDSFKESQAQILKYPLQFLGLLEKFQRNFDQFQRALSDWYNRKYERTRTVERYCSYVSLALSLGGKLIVVGSDLGTYEKAFSTFVSDQITKNIPKKVKGYAAKLMVGVYDIGKQQLDADRTYTIELMQTNAELMKEDVVALLNSINRKAGAGIPGTSEQVADQGI